VGFWHSREVAKTQVAKLALLPPPNTIRWTPRRKAEVVAAVRSGLIRLDEACRRYNLTSEEFASWWRLFEKHGVAGLRLTHPPEPARRHDPAA
jgi:transposase-like protein